MLNTFTLAAWATLAIVYAAAYALGSEFASSKNSATVFGCVIGLAAFFAWLGVEEEEAEGEAVSPGAGSVQDGMKQTPRTGQKPKKA